MSDENALNMSAEQFAELVRSAPTEGEIAEGIREVGTAAVVGRVFSEMGERFQPDRAKGVEADVQWVVRDGSDEHRYALRIADGSCAIAEGDVDEPKVTLTADLPAFAKLVTGAEGGPTLFMRGKLQVSGDLFFAQRITQFFDQPA
jgi:putative sterol carrier protein